MKLYFKSCRSDEYNATGIYKDGNLTVLKGSKIRINPENNYKRNEYADSIRNNPEYVKNNILQKDVTFKSASTAAQFVIDQSINGLNVWKDENKKKLKDLK